MPHMPQEGEDHRNPPHDHQEEEEEEERGGNKSEVELWGKQRERGISKEGGGREGGEKGEGGRGGEIH